MTTVRSRGIHWTRMKENEMLIRSSETKFCDGCCQILPANLTYFGRSCVKKTDNYNLVYLRPRCRKCFTQKKTASIERRREIARNHYYNNIDKKTKQRQILNIRRRLVKHFTNKIEKNKWKNRYNIVLQSINK